MKNRRSFLAVPAVAALLGTMALAGCYDDGRPQRGWGSGQRCDSRHDRDCRDRHDGRGHRYDRHDGDRYDHDGRPYRR